MARQPESTGHDPQEMDNGIDYRRELEQARNHAARCGRDGTEASLEAHWEVCCGDVLCAEENLRSQNGTWENASLAREFLDTAHYLEGYDDMLDNIYAAVRRMRDALPEHPRLTIGLLELERTAIMRIEALCGHELGAVEDVEAELSRYRHNVACADRGCFDAIVDTGHLKSDPIEWSAAYEDIIDEADRRTYALLKGFPRGMGFCLAYWNARARVLETCYGIRWRSPAAMNPGVMFD